MANDMRIEGLEEMRRALDLTVKEMDDITVKAMRSATRPVARKIRSRLGSGEYGFLVKSKAVKGKKTRSGYPTAVIGMLKPPFARRGKSGSKKWFNWYKAYWKNYGTLGKRSPSHHFVEPIRPNSRGTAGGITPRGFFEQALTGVNWQAEIRAGFSKNLAKQLDKIKSRVI